MYPDFKPTRFLADGAMDDHSIYKMVMNHGMQPFIPLPENKRYPVLDDYRKTRNLTKLDTRSAAAAFLGPILGSIPRSSGTNTDVPTLLLKRKSPTAIYALNAIKPKAHMDQLSIRSLAMISDYIRQFLGAPNNLAMFSNADPVSNAHLNDNSLTTALNDTRREVVLFGSHWLHLPP